MKFKEHLTEARNDSLVRKFNKAMLWYNTDPKKMKREIEKMSDDDILSLYDESDLMKASSGSERKLQMNLLKREIKRRGLK